MKRILNETTTERLQELFNTHNSISGILRELKVSETCQHNRHLLKKRINEIDITQHEQNKIDTNPYHNGLDHKLDDEQYFCVGNKRKMSDLGDLGGEVLGAFMPITFGVIALFALPFMLIDKCSQHFSEKKAKVEQAAKVYEVASNPKESIKHPILTYQYLKTEKEPIVNVPKESLSFRAGQAVKQSSKDFVRGLFTKKPKPEQ